jgi:hypothetical protein
MGNREMMMMVIIDGWMDGQTDKKFLNKEISTFVMVFIF